jgi:phosphosulfolactate phosphohydrolase-like enzyme
MDGHLLHKHPERPIYVRQFGEGARRAAEDKGITVIIDNFRASNTILALLQAGALVKPVETVEEALKYSDHIKVGEKDGKKHKSFDYDNSPYKIQKHADRLKGKHVVLRTTNGTRGIINAKGSKQILIGAFRNLTAIVDYCVPYAKQNIPISFVAMGSKDISRIEDYFGAQMMFFRLIDRIGNSPELRALMNSEVNPWNINWQDKIQDERDFYDFRREDRLYSIQLDKTSIIPLYNEEKQIIEMISL